MEEEASQTDGRRVEDGKPGQDSLKIVERSSSRTQMLATMQHGSQDSINITLRGLSDALEVRL